LWLYFISTVFNHLYFSFQTLSLFSYVLVSSFKFQSSSTAALDPVFTADSKETATFSPPFNQSDNEKDNVVITPQPSVFHRDAGPHIEIEAQNFGDKIIY
jgi:hypothetical protein